MKKTTCFNCKKSVSKDDYCYGCKHTVCEGCDVGHIAGTHTKEAHLMCGNCGYTTVGEKW